MGVTSAAAWPSLVSSGFFVLSSSFLLAHLLLQIRDKLQNKQNIGVKRVFIPASDEISVVGFKPQSPLLRVPSL